jgi:hypothetical protein
MVAAVTCSVGVPVVAVPDADPVERSDWAPDPDRAPDPDCMPPERPVCDPASPSAALPLGRPPPRMRLLEVSAAGVIVPVICILWLTCAARSTPPIGTSRYPVARLPVPLRPVAGWLAPAPLAPPPASPDRPGEVELPPPDRLVDEAPVGDEPVAGWTFVSLNIASD